MFPHETCENASNATDVLDEWLRPNPLIGQTLIPAAITEHGIPLSRTDFQRCLCDSTITRIITGPTSEPLDVGREERFATRAIRKAVIKRDRRCRFPGCDRLPRWCEIHHVVPWEAGGDTSVDNLVLICRYHHHVLHLPGWNHKLDRHNQLFITNPNGDQIE